MDPERGPLVAKLFEWYATGTVSLKEVTARAAAIGLTHPRSARKLTKSEIHRVLHNPIYAGEFRWKGKQYAGLHTPIISRRLFEDVQDVFAVINRPRYTKHQHAFAGLMTCGRCGCAITAELKKGKYVYYHCTGFKGRCGNTYIREEELSHLFSEVVRRIQISPEVAEWITEALRESQDDKQKFHRASVMRQQQHYLAVQAKIDRAYEDRLAGRVSDDLWERKTQQWEQELADIRRDTALQEAASHDYAARGSKILELAQTAPAQFVSQNSVEQARLLKTLLSNCSFDRGSLSVAWVKPFDLLAAGNENGDWLWTWLGLYATTAFQVNTRRPELGLMRALGAGDGAIYQTVLLPAGRVVLVGAAAGLVLAVLALFAGRHYLLAFGVGGTALVLAVPIALGIVVLAAAFVPAHRASRVQPMGLLRNL